MRPRSVPRFGRYRIDHVDGGLLCLGGDDLRRERARHYPTRDPGSNTLGLLEFELAHFPMADRRQTAIVHHNVLADRRAAHDRSDAERIVALTRRAMGVDVDNVGHVHSNVAQESECRSHRCELLADYRALIYG